MTSILDHKINEEVIDFLITSNEIEQETSAVALEDAILAWNAVLGHHDHSRDGSSCFRPWRCDSISTILIAHRVLMRRLRPDIAGKVRNCAVEVGSRTCPLTSEALIKQELQAWYEEHILADTWDAIKKAHIAFEHLHPFEDGNGRVGRIIMNVQCIYAGRKPLIIRPGKEQAEYYRWF